MNIIEKWHLNWASKQGYKDESEWKSVEEVIDEIRETIYKDVPTPKDVTALYNKTKNGALKVGASEQQATYEAQLAVHNYHQGFSDGINERNKLISKLSKIVGLS